ncbi:Ctlh/cra c-terminal to lish motif domain [Globisporangium polare]
MQWAVAAHGPAGKVHADRRTVEYFGRGNHARDAACFRTTRPVSAFPHAHSLSTRQRSKPQRLQLKQKNAMDKSGAHRGKSCAGTAGGHGSARGVAGADERKEKKAHEDDDDEDALSLSKLRMFYYETLVVSTRDDDESGFAGEDDSERDARAELDLLMARANAAAAAINSSTSTHHGTVHRATDPASTAASTPHPYLNARAPGSRLPWRERARRIVHANLRAADSLGRENSSSSDAGEEDTAVHEDNDTRMELDSVGAITVSNSNGHDESFPARSEANELRNSNNDNNTQSRSRSGSNHSSTSNANNNHSSNSAANGVHFAFTLSSRTLQQIRSRHERRRMRRHQERKRFNHRIGVGFVLASKSNRDLIAHDGLSQVSTSSSISNSPSPLKNLSSYQQQKQVNHDDLGKDAFSLAYHGKTGCIMSNGQVFLQCEKFGSGDVVGCGILLDTKTFFFTLNGRLLGMLAATDVHHFDDFVDDGATVDGIVIGDDGDEESDVDFEADEDDDGSDEESDASLQGEGTLFEDVLYPAVSLHDAGECACANFNEFRFDLAGFERQILKERQQALLLHEIADEREEEANDRVINKLIQDYFLHYGHKDAFTVFQKSASFSQPAFSSTMDEDDVVTDMHIDEEEKTEAMDTGNPSSSSLKPLSSAQTKLLNLRHAVRQHIYAFETDEALAKVRAALGDAFFLSATRRRRGGKVLFYSRVLCVLDVLMQRARSEHLAKAKAGNENGYNGKQNGNRGNGGWNVEEAILCAQDQFSGYLALSPTRTQEAARHESDSIETNESKNPQNLFAQSVMDGELELVMSLLLYEREEDVPADSAARKFLSPKFREHVADELNVFLLMNSSPRSKTASGAHQRRRFSPPSALGAAIRKDASASALQNFLVELNSLQSQCLRNGCRVFPGNHTVSSSGGKRSSSRRRRRHASASSSDNGDGNGDEEMRSSSSGSDMSASSSRSENDDDDDDDEEEE